MAAVDRDGRGSSAGPAGVPQPDSRRSLRGAAPQSAVAPVGVEWGKPPARGRAAPPGQILGRGWHNATSPHPGCRGSGPWPAPSPPATEMPTAACCYCRSESPPAPTGLHSPARARQNDWARCKSCAARAANQWRASTECSSAWLRGWSPPPGVPASRRCSNTAARTACTSSIRT